VRLLDEVAAGACLGEIVDVAGDEIDRIVTPVSGTVWAWRATPAMRPGDLVGMIALAPDGAS
jgi:predicted deacylase